MLLYLDDDIVHGLLVKLLRKAGHDTQIPTDVGRYGASDPVHLTHAITAGRVLMSHNHDDFEQLHDLVVAAAGHHPGILIVRKDNDKRDLKPPRIVIALAKLIASNNPVPDQFIVLNHYR
jgi:predicted nuclease of predicted toxin-antitoxin system